MKSRDSLPSWDLSDLFSAASDPKIEKIFTATSREAAMFSRRYRGKIVPEPLKVARLLEAYEKLLLEASKPLHYASLLFAESSSERGRGALLQRCQTEYTAVTQELLFVELELLGFPDRILKRLIAHKSLKRYSHFLHVLLLSKPHRLSESEERILADKGLTGRSALVRLFDEELSEKKFRLTKGSKKIEASESEVLSLLYDKRRDVRKNAASALTTGLREESRRLTLITNTLLQDKAIDDKYRKYRDSEASRHLANEIDQKMVDAMVGAVTANYSLVRDFYTFKRSKMGVARLFDYDRYAPLGPKTRPIPFREAREMVLGAFYGFSEAYGDIASEFFDRGWIDAAPRPGKRGGAFCSFVTPDLHPYVFMNYSGTIREVFTLAHELGHAIHAYLMREQNYLNFDVPLTIAETASVFAEMLLFDFMKTRIRSGPELLSLYVGKIESVFATVFRQVSMYLFERDLHAARREGELSTEGISSLWRARQVEMFGKSVTLTPDYDIWWSYIPHFVHTPFYVYAYAFGELLTLSLHARYKEEGEPFVEKYMSLLRSGGSKTPAELLRPMKVDLKGRDFWEGGVRTIALMVREVKRLSTRS